MFVIPVLGRQGWEGLWALLARQSNQLALDPSKLQEKQYFLGCALYVDFRNTQACTHTHTLTQTHTHTHNHIQIQNEHT